MNKYILIVVENNINKFINKCNKYKIELLNLYYVDNNKIIVKIKKEDYDLIKKYNYYSKVCIYKKVGLDNIKDKIYKEKYFILVFILCLISMYLITNIIFDINVIHSNKDIRNLVLEELNENGIKKYSLKKDFNELINIKDKILESNKDKLEWISITNVGMTVVVRIEERIIDDIRKNKEYCNVVSKKEALVTKIYSTNGEIIVNVNDVVKTDDILISGNILLNEEIKGFTCASGKVMGKVWYNTNITINRNYKIKKYTGSERINILFNNKILRNNKYSNFDKKYIFKTKYFSIYKEKEYKFINKKYSEEDCVEKALIEVDNKFKKKIKDVKIINKKILSKNINDKIAELKIFVVTEEYISKQIMLNKPIIENE